MYTPELQPNTQPCEEPKEKQDSSYTAEVIFLKATLRRERGRDIGVVTKWVGYWRHRKPPWGMMGSSPTSESPTLGSCTGRWTPITSVFESQWNIFIGYPQGNKKVRLHSPKACPQSNLLLNPAQRQESEKHWITYEAFGLILGHVVQKQDLWILFQ